MGISIWQVLIILLIVILLFGTKKLRNIGTDLGGALKGFKKAMNEDEVSNHEQTKDADFEKVENKDTQTVDQSQTSKKDSSKS